MPQPPYDYSTLHIPRLMQCPVATLTPAQHFALMPGIACCLLPPGHPNYFLVPILDFSDEREDENIYIRDPVGRYRLVGQESDLLTEEMGQFWRPLPIDHIRCLFWQRECYLALYDCVFDFEAGQLIRDVDFAHHQELLPYHAATLFIRTFYPHYQLSNQEWALYRPHHDPQQLANGLLWHGEWIACVNAHGKPMEYGWERFRLHQFEKVHKFA